MVARMEAYSVPMTPPPMMASDVGSCLSASSPSVSMIETSSKGICGGRAGMVPVAMTI